MEVITTPMGYLPKFKDLQKLFQDIIGKMYTEELYNKQFALYIDKIVARIDLQTEAYSKETEIPAKLFQVLEEQRTGLIKLKDAYGPIVKPAQLVAFQA